MFKKVKPYMGRFRKYTYGSIVVMTLAIVFSVLPYFFLYRILKPLLTGETLRPETAAVWVLLILASEVLYAFLYIKGLSLSHTGAYNTLRNIRSSLQEKMETQPLGSILELGTGTVKKLFTDDIETIELLLAHAIPEGIANLLIPVVVILAMFFVDWKLALLSLASLPIGMGAMGAMFRAGMAKMGEYYASAARMNNTIVEYVNGMEVVKVFGRDGESYERFETDVKSYRDFTLAWYKVCWPWMALYSSILPCICLIMLPAGAYLVVRGSVSLTDFVLVLCMSFAIGPALLHAMSFAGKTPQLNYKIEELEKRMNAPSLKQSDRPFSGAGHDVSFEDVHFSYLQEEGNEVLHGVSAVMKEGTRTALVGASGSGKSTLAKLLVHYYDVTGGTISIGGQNITDMSVEALNTQISYVAQEQFLFNTSLLENIRMGRPSATREEVLEAAEKAQCTEFLERFPDGIDTQAGDGGKQLSGGERQRISLARAILKNAPVVVLDEATAFIDPENEEKMNAAITEVVRNKTVIVIAHRLRTVMDADQILVLDSGRIAAQGTHRELLESSEQYRTLWEASEQSASWRIGTTGEEVPT